MKNPYDMDEYLSPPGQMNEIVGEGEGGCWPQMAFVFSCTALVTGLAILGGAVVAAMAV